jgi:hypothetical protein
MTLREVERAPRKKRGRPAPPPLRDDVEQLVPDQVVWGELGITPMTGWRWTCQAKYRHLNFPPLIKINGRNFRSRRMLEEWKQNLMRKAIAARGEMGGA